MKIRIQSEAELVSIATELVHCLCNLRKFQKLWEANHGVELKQRKKYYEEKADELLKRLEVTEHKHPNEIKIEVNA